MNQISVHWQRGEKMKQRIRYGRSLTMQPSKLIRLHSARGCVATADLQYIIVPYVAKLEEDFRPVIKYAVVDTINGLVKASGFSDEYEAEDEVISYYAS